MLFEHARLPVSLQYGIVGVGFVCMLAVWWFFVYQPLSENIKTLRDTCLLPNDYGTRTISARQRIAELHKQLQEYTEKGKGSMALAKKATDLGLNVLLCAQRLDATYELKLEGNYELFEVFLAHIVCQSCSLKRISDTLLAGSIILPAEH